MFSFRLQSLLEEKEKEVQMAGGRGLIYRRSEVFATQLSVCRTSACRPLSASAALAPSPSPSPSGGRWRVPLGRSRAAACSMQGGWSWRLVGDLWRCGQDGEIRPQEAHELRVHLSLWMVSEHEHVVQSRTLNWAYLEGFLAVP